MLFRSHFAVAHAFVCPLRDTVQDWARCPSKLFMYLPFRKPILTSPIGEAKELLGDDAFFYNPGDVEGLAGAMRRALDTDHFTMSLDPAAHTWQARVDQFLAWLAARNGGA